MACRSGDIAEQSVCAAVARKAIDALGAIDILVNNAAFQRSYDKLEDISDDEFEETFRVNIFAMFRLSKALLPQMKEVRSSPSIPARVLLLTPQPKRPS